METPRIDPSKLKTERHDVDLGAEETPYGKAGSPDEPGEKQFEKPLDQKGASPIPNQD